MRPNAMLIIIVCNSAVIILLRKVITTAHKACYKDHILLSINCRLVLNF